MYTLTNVSENMACLLVRVQIKAWNQKCGVQSERRRHHVAAYILCVVDCMETSLTQVDAREENLFNIYENAIYFDFNEGAQCSGEGEGVPAMLFHGYELQAGKCLLT